ncbi:MAG: MerR family transcriptional regulator [Clostridiaceae bacterium]
MEYTVTKLAKISGVSARTLRYYDEIGLLSPARIDSNSYRVYNEEQVDILQQILFYRALGISLQKIKNLLKSHDYDREKALQSHLSELNRQKEQIDMLIRNVKKTIASMKGEIIMSNKEKFEGFKQKLIDENEKKYGKEARESFGDAAVDASNAKIKGMTQEQYARIEKLTEDLNNTLAEAFKTGNPGGELAKKACELHKEWLCCYWPDGTYSPEAHMALAQGYVDDKRFTEYYDKIALGCTEFLRDAINIFCGK